MGFAADRVGHHRGRSRTRRVNRVEGRLTRPVVPPPVEPTRTLPQPLAAAVTAAGLGVRSDGTCEATPGQGHPASVSASLTLPVRGEDERMARNSTNQTTTVRSSVSNGVGTAGASQLTSREMRLRAKLDRYQDEIAALEERVENLEAEVARLAGYEHALAICRPDLIARFCSRCECPADKATPGCRTCYWRHRQRRKRRAEIRQLGLCVGCLQPLADRTPGCSPCRYRHSKRRKAA